MTTIIDSLVIELGLDPKKLDQGKREAVDSLRDLEVKANKHTGGVQDGFAKLGTELSSVQGRLLGLAAIFLGGMGLKNFAEHIAQVTNNLSRMSMQAGVSARDLSAWGNVGAMAGANPGAVQGAVSSFSSAVYGNRLQVNPQLLSSLAAMNVKMREGPDGKFDINGMLMDMSKYTVGKNPADASAMLGKVPGMNSDMITLLLQGPEELKRKLSEMGKLGPTPEELAAMNRLTESWAKMSATAEKLGRVLLTAVEPVLEKILGVAEKFFGYSADEKGREQMMLDGQNNATTFSERWAEYKAGKRTWYSAIWGGGKADGGASGAGSGEPAPGGAAPSVGGGNEFRSGRTGVAKQAMMEQLKQEGVPDEHLEAAASALTGQAIAESGLNPNADHDGGTGYGIYGARDDPRSGPEGQRRTKMLTWLAANGFARNSLEGQAKYMAHEAMSMRYMASRRALMQATSQNLPAVNGVLTDTFEAPTIRNYSPRLKNAYTALHTAVKGANASVNNSRSSTSTSETNVGEVHVHAPSDSVHDIAGTLKGALINTPNVVQSNTGPW